MIVSAPELLDEDGNVVPANSGRRRDAVGNSRAPTPYVPEPWRARRSIHLASLDETRVEMAKVYRAMANGMVATSEGSKLIFALSQIGRIIEVSQLEARIARLEQAGTPLALQYEPENDDGIEP